MEQLQTRISSKNLEKTNLQRYVVTDGGKNLCGTEKGLVGQNLQF